MARRLLIFWLCLCLALLPGLSWALTLEEEREIGRKALKEVEAEMPLVHDPDSVEYVRNLGKRLTATLADDPFKYHFYIANSPDYNAFALPGGWIFFFRGMITSMDNEAELASVMAHEISHVHYRHLSQRIKRSGPVNIATLAGMVAGMLLGALAGSPALGQAVTMGSVAGGIQKQLAFSREAEEQADYGAFKILSATGYSPEDMANSFRHIWRIQRSSMPEMPSYLMTHPPSPERLEQVEDLARRHPVHLRPYDNSEFLRIRARLKALYEPMDTAEKDFVQTLTRKPNDPYALYGLALLGMRKARYEKSLQLLKKLRSEWPDKPSVRREMGICHLRLGEFEQAQSLLTSALERNPHDLSARLALGQSYLMQGRPAVARGVLHEVLKQDPHNNQASYDLGVALGRLGDIGLASYYLGMAFKGRHNMNAAKYHLERAQRELVNRPDLQAKATKALEELEGKGKGKKPPSGEQR